MEYTVRWTQRYRVGPTGDDIDYETLERSCKSLDDAKLFVKALLEGKHRGYADCRVHERDVQIVKGQL